MDKVFSQKALIFFVCLLIFFQLFQIIYFEKSFFLESYDTGYWKDRFDHSQWRLPLSKRIIGDDGLYSYVGYQLIRGSSLDFVNAETPPLGKYLIGLSIAIFHNTASYALFFGMGTLLLFYLIAKKLTSGLTALLLTAGLFLEPLFFTQLWKAWLDIAQLFFLLANLFFLLSSPVLAGIFLGLFSVSKTPLLAPFVFLPEVFFFVIKKQWRKCLILIVGMGAAVLVVYSYYFISGHSLIDFLKLQKYMIWFYKQSQIKANLGAVWQVLFLGRFPDISFGAISPVAEWWILWPVLTAVGIIIALKTLLTKGVSLVWKELGFFVLLSLLVYTFIPVYPRYLLIILPFLFLFVGQLIEKANKAKLALPILGVVLLISFIRAFLFLLPTPNLVLNNFYYNLSHQYFQDVYEEDLAKENQPLGNRDQFWKICQKALNQTTVKAIEVEEKERKISRFGNKGEVKLLLTYKTQDLGPFSEEKIIKLVKEANQWKIVWNWDILLNGFSPDYQIGVEITPGSRGAIISQKRGVLVEDRLGYLVSVKPYEVDPQKEERMLELISELSGLGGVVLYNAYQENILPGTIVPLVSLATMPDKQTEKDLLSYPGVVLTKYPVRVYNDFSSTDIENTFYDECCTRIYSRFSYRGVRGPEKLYDNLLYGYDGGKISMRNENGEVLRTILEKEAKTGQDVVLPTEK